MIEELDTARNLLNTALDQYINVCSTIQNRCTSGTLPDDLQLGRLVDCAADELLWSDSYKSKLKRARAAMRVVRNCSPILVPINSLPSEVLVYIFQLVLNSQPCFGAQALKSTTSYKYQGPEFPDYPDLLLTVCQRWRLIAIEASALWSHIDLVLAHPFSERLLGRAKRYAHRVDRSLLDIHIVNSNYNTPESNGVVSFFRSVATRIRSLELVVPNAHVGTPKAVLHTCLSKCVPGTLKIVRIKQSGVLTPIFIGAAENPPNPKPPRHDSDSESDVPDPKTFSLLLDIAENTIEDLWSQVTSLRLCNLYPYWTSAAYHGLTELRLFPESRSSLDRAPIPESQLVRILASSPRLRILHFNLEITEPVSMTSSVTPVPLSDLRVLNASKLPYDQLGIFLRWIAPGSTPIQFSIELPRASQWTEFGPREALNQFLARSTVSDLCLNLLYAHLSQVYVLIRLVPNIRVLVLRNVSCDSQKCDSDVDFGGEGARAPSQLSHLYILDGMLDFDTVHILGQIVRERAVQRFTLWYCSYYHDMNSHPDEGVLKESILAIHPTAQLIAQHEPKPLSDWDIVA